MTTHNIKEKVNEFYDFIKKDSQHRYKSWEHCYSYFYTHKATLLESEILDKAALHLGMYLASWGMFRGSGGLLWKDYTIYKDLIAQIYPALLQNDTGKLANEIGEFFSKVTMQKAKETETKNDEDFKVEEKNINPTITLVSKIMLGLNASCVALDEFVCSGINKETQKNYHSKKYNEIPDAIESVMKFYNGNKQDFDNLQNEIKLELDNGEKIPYPIIKLLDMYFFQIGERN